MKGKRKLFFISGAILTASFSLLVAREFRVTKIPNGDTFSCNTCHLNGGGSARNPFGLEVESRVTPNGAQNFWDESLAALDSDGDGFSNGAELQDPAGTWRPGQSQPGNPALVSNPGDPNSKPVSTALENINGFDSSYKLIGNYPNPFNPETTIRFSVPALKTGLSFAMQPVLIKVFDSLGKEVVTLLHELKSPGEHEVRFDAADLAGGVYYYRMQAGEFSAVRKMILIK